MIDYRTYHNFHPNTAAFVFSGKPKVPFDSWPTTIANNIMTLDEVHLILLPPEIHAFPLKEKKWCKWPCCPFENCED